MRAQCRAFAGPAFVLHWGPRDILTRKARSLKVRVHSNSTNDLSAERSFELVLRAPPVSELVQPRHQELSVPACDACVYVHPICIVDMQVRLDRLCWSGRPLRKVPCQKRKELLTGSDSGAAPKRSAV